MTDTDRGQDAKPVLAEALTLIEAHARQVETMRRSIEAATDHQQRQAEIIAEMTRQIAQLEALLRESGEGLSEALSVLAALRAGLEQVNRATTATVTRLIDSGGGPDLTQSVKALTDAVTRTADNDLLEGHEKYLMSLREKLTRKSF